MKTQNFIDKDRVLLPSQDYDLLRKIGMQYIEKYGNSLWTDYNAHDPGITILEVLSYAITELGYRTNFNIKDLLANKDGDISNTTFFPANKILTGSPLTEIDYRKILLDIEGISNAWFLATKKEKFPKGVNDYGYFMPNDPNDPNDFASITTNERKLYLNPLDDKLSLQNLNSKGDENRNSILMRGLNKIILELEDDPVLGDLNSTNIEFEFLSNDKWIQVLIIPMFESWNDDKSLVFDTINEETITQIPNGVLSDASSVTIRFKNYGTLIELIVNPYNLIELVDTVTYFNDFDNVRSLVKLYKDKKQKVKNINEAVIDKLNENRNLSEDYYSIETIKSIPIGVCAKIEIEPQINVVDIMALIQITIHNIISPPIHFYSLTQLLDQGFATEEIFDGPSLVHGFLKNEEVYKTQLPDAIHVSDIIAAVMKLEGVISISEVLLTEYDQYGKAIESKSNKPWCLELSGQQNPIFSTTKSRLQLYKKNIPFLLSEANQMIVDQKIEIYKSSQRTKKMKESELDFPFPIGNFYQLDEFYSIQDEFPINYGLGKNTLSDKVEEKRKAQVKQLKGYLHFYDQILADFFKQLYHAKDLLNISTLEQTYFTSFLDKNPLSGDQFYNKELYSDDLEEKLFSLDSYDISLYENKTLFYDRRNRALDHLIARFGESFNDYVFMMYQVKQETNSLGEMGLEYEEIILDKQRFLSQYPELSSKRGLGMNYLLSEDYFLSKNSLNIGTFEISNFGGYEKRVAKLLGINDLNVGNFNIEILNEKKIKVKSTLDLAQYKVNTFDFQMFDTRQWIINNINNESIYSIFKTESRFFIYITRDTKKIARFSKSYKTRIEADQGLVEIFNAVDEKTEKFFCLEHILLRPFKFFDSIDEEHLMLPVCLNDDCDDPAGNDPYSFKATIVIPGYLPRFQNMTFRKYAEKVFRQESPAHVLLKICWVNESDMKDFHLVYKNWKSTYSVYRKIKNHDALFLNNHVINHKALIKKIKELHTTYPEGNLYDCQYSETSNPIILGNTALGTL
ncbi:hypothetical protein OX283_009380 [Flavobacterium sp. SUN052]|uniref:hypothetical protein n=1 Tax=Flavobacterium sp. SUN052 TaxID=3002441 RepID=UPI00237E433E|nr:hypothetical protein [Flavobacterium sp. SUN052]MEC4004865.1 hypothetical protein [Flavobacterium sp. SUN052]